MDDYSNDASTNSLLDLSFADQFGVIDYAGDQDWLRMELAGGTSYEIHVHGQDFGYQLAQPRIKIFDGANNLIATSDSAGGGVVLTFTALSYGTHYLAIDSSDPTEIGDYNFHGFGDDNSGSARLSINGQSLGALEYFTDEDSFKFKLIAGLSYVFDLRGQATGAGTLQDPLLLLRDSNGATLASDDDSGEGADSRIVFTPTVSGDYSLAARESGDNGLGSYTISASAPLGLTIAAVSADQAEGNTGSKAFGFTFTRSGDLSTAIFVPWAVTGTGANPADAADFANGVLPSGNIALAVGEASKSLGVNVRGDTQVEPDESFLVTLSSPTHGTASATGLIRNDDGVASISIAASSASLNEGSSGDTAFGFTVTRSGSLSAAASVAWTVTGTGANPANAADFTNGLLPSGTVAFAAGETSKALSVLVHGDSQVEPDEGFLVTLSGPSNGAILGTASANGLIRNDDTAPSISIAASNASLNEGSSGDTAFGFTVTRSGDPSVAASVAWAVTGTGANPTNAADFTNGVLPSGSIAFAAGETSKTLSVLVHGDTLVEPNEGFQVTLSGPTNGAVIGTAAASGLIQNDDASFNAVNGTANGETLTGTLGADHIQGLGGNDSLIGRAGNDILDGGTGTDRADWLSDGGTLAVNVDMASGTATRGTEVDTLLNIEDLRGTQFADTLQGNDSVNVLDGNAGNDTLNGRGGDDLLAGSTGSNTLDGGAGTDRVTYSGSSTAISLDLGTDTVTRGTETDQIFNIENATGSPSADTMRGDTANNLLQGLGGNDTLLGLDGNDTIVGGAGKDSMTGGTGRDVFDFAAGESGINANADIINGFDGVGATAGDTIDLRDVFSGTLAFRGTSAFSGVNQVHLVNEGTATIVEINLSGTTAPEMEMRIEDGATTAASWTAADFLL